MLLKPYTVPHDIVLGLGTVGLPHLRAEGILSVESGLPQVFSLLPAVLYEVVLEFSLYCPLYLVQLVALVLLGEFPLREVLHVQFTGPPEYHVLRTPPEAVVGGLRLTGCLNVSVSGWKEAY